MSDQDVVVKLRKGKKDYEVLVHLEAALAWKAGKPLSFEHDVLVIDAVFEDAKKGKRASIHEMKSLFVTDDTIEVAKKIVQEGHLPQTEAMMRQALEQKRRKIIDLIHRNTVDPNTEKPHSLSLIETALNELKFKIDEHKPAEQQFDLVLKAMRKLLPLKYEVREVLVRIPHQYTARALPLLRQRAKILQEKWEADGGLFATLELPAGLQEELEIALNNLTHGEVELRLIATR
ncbi:ribosome assembly factor SBDS [Candidatus Woesearchaeota archaeon]|nr:ribosome assembly factor SBDS [Candidatus Woesearchaeota archaeon]